MKNKNQNGITIGLGIPTILLIFGIISMCIISVLTYYVSSQNVKAANKEREAVEAYYQADMKMKYVMNHIDEDLTTYFDKEKIQYEQNGNKQIVHIEIDENRQLEMIVENQKIDTYKVVFKEN